MQSVSALFDVLVLKAKTDPTLRKSLLAFVNSLNESVSTMPGIETVASSVVVPQHQERTPFVSSVPTNNFTPSFSGGGWETQIPSNDDLLTIETRMRLKSESTRWAAERQKLLKSGANFHEAIEPRDRDIISQAKSLPECYLWMNAKESQIPSDLTVYTDLSASFMTAANAIAALRSVLALQNKPVEVMEEILHLTAEAQSCVRSGVMQLTEKPDKDQMKIFYWLRNAGGEYQILIKRYMRQNDIADFRNHADVQTRLNSFNERFGKEKANAKQQKLLGNKVRHLSGKLLSESTDEDWVELVKSVDELIDSGISPSNRELCTLINPIIDQMPEMELPENFLEFKQELERFGQVEEELVEEEVPEEVEV